MQAEYIQGLWLHISSSQKGAYSMASFRHKETCLNFTVLRCVKYILARILLSSGILLNEWSLIMILYDSGFKEYRRCREVSIYS